MGAWIRSVMSALVDTLVSERQVKKGDSSIEPRVPTRDAIKRRTWQKVTDVVEDAVFQVKARELC